MMKRLLGSGAAEGDSKDSQRLGDAARDRKQWAEAAGHYTAHLAVKPEDRAIWIQLGHALKESGAYADALAAYNKAMALDEADYDIHLQKGHLLKRMNRRNEAIAAYRQSLEYQFEDNESFRELLALGAIDEATMAAEGKLIERSDKAIYIDITDLLDYMKINTSLSGIQRVISVLVSNISKYLSDGKDITIVPVYYEYETSKILAVNTALVVAMLKIIEVSGPNREILDKAIRAVYDSRYSINMRFGDTIIIAGAFWIYPNYDVISAARQIGVSFGVFIHDLIQIRDPEYVHFEATLVFRKQFIDVLSIADFVLTNSIYVKQEVTKFLNEQLNFDVPVVAVQLATELQPANLATITIEPEIIDVCREDFVLCVATIEIRKNHMYLIRIWEKLIKEYKGDIPKLVFVGKWGWNIDELRGYLDKSDYLGGRLHIFNGISDSALTYLYQHCLFSVYPSFAEGWGLPVGESLAHGKPCVASNTTSLPEVGGAFARYIDPFNVRDGYRVIHGILEDRPGLAQWTQGIWGSFKPKSWSQFSHEFFDAVAKGGEAHPGKKAWNNVILDPGEIYPIGDKEVDRLERVHKPLVTFRMARVSGWRPVEDWVCWTAKRRASLRFHTTVAAGTMVKLYMLLRAADGSGNVSCAIIAGEKEATNLLELSNQQAWIISDGVVSEDGDLNIAITCNGRFEISDGRERYIGVSALAYCPAADMAARVSLLEKVTLYRPGDRG